MWIGRTTKEDSRLKCKSTNGTRRNLNTCGSRQIETKKLRLEPTQWRRPSITTTISHSTRKRHLSQKCKHIRFFRKQKTLSTSIHIDHGTYFTTAINTTNKHGAPWIQWNSNSDNCSSKLWNHQHVSKSQLPRSLPLNPKSPSQTSSSSLAMPAN